MSVVTRRVVGICAAIAVGGAVLWGGFVIAGAPYCEEAERLQGTTFLQILQALVTPNDDRMAGLRCAEFWLNRYQVLLAGLLVFGGGLAVALGLHRQVETAMRIAQAQRRDDRDAADRPSTEAWSEFAAYLPQIHGIAERIATSLDIILADSHRTAERDAALAALIRIDRYSNIDGLAYVARDMSRLIRYMRPGHALGAERFQFLLSQTAQGLSALVGHLNVADRPDADFARIVRERALRLSEEAAAYLGAGDWSAPAAEGFENGAEGDEGLVA